MSIRDTILNADDFDRATFDVPEWGVKLELRSPSGEERAKLAALYGTSDDDGPDETARKREQLYAAMIVFTAHDPDTGERIFEAGDVAAVNAKSAAVIYRLGPEALRIAGMDADAQEREGKDSSPDPSNASGSS